MTDSALEIWIPTVATLGAALIAVVASNRSDKRKSRQAVTVANATAAKIEQTRKEDLERAATEKKELAAIAAARNDEKTAGAIDKLGSKIDEHVIRFDRHCEDDLEFQKEINQKVGSINEHVIVLTERMSGFDSGFKRLETKLDKAVESKR